MRKYIEQEAPAAEGGSENSRTEPEMGVYVRIEDVMMMPQEDLIETFAKAAAKEQDEVAIRTLRAEIERLHRENFWLTNGNGVDGLPRPCGPRNDEENESGAAAT